MSTYYCNICDCGPCEVTIDSDDMADTTYCLVDEDLTAEFIQLEKL